MSTAAQATAFADDVYELLAQLDPTVFRAEMTAAAEQAIARLRVEATTLRARLDAMPTRAEAEERLRQAVIALSERLPEASGLRDKADWDALRRELEPAYEAMAAAIRAQGERVRHLRPTNLVRSAVHLACGIVVAVAFEHVLTVGLAIGIAAAWVVWAWSLESTRRLWPGWNDFLMRFFGPITRAHERYRVNSATWYGTALLLVALTVPDHRGILGLLTVAAGDPAAGLVGRRWGRTRIGERRTLEGALGFVAAAFVVGATYLAVYHAGLGAVAIVALAATAAITGAIAEVLSTRLDDNFTVPLVAAWSAAAVSIVL